MAFTLDDPAIKALLEADVAAAWAPQQLYRGRAMTPASVANLPRAFIFLNDITVERGRSAASAGEAMVPHRYTITLQQPWPATGEIEDDKVAKAQVLLTRLTAASGQRYGGWLRNVVSVRFDDTAVVNEEQYYIIDIDFELEVITDE